VRIKADVYLPHYNWRYAMRLSCLQENLSKGLGVVGRAVATRATLPVTGNVLLATDRSRLKLTATNLEIAITTWIGAKVEEEGAITVPARLFTEFINSLPNEKIDMSLSHNTLELKCARVEAHMGGIDAEEFPPTPTIGDGTTTSIDSEALRSAIAQVIFATASDDSRPILTGAHAKFEGDKLTLAAADGFRLAVHNAPLTAPVAETCEIIIPGRALSELGRLVSDQEEPVEVGVGKSQVLFRWKNAEMVSQLLQGAFPNYEQVIPKEHTTRAVVSNAEFLRAARTAFIFARDSSGIMRLEITPGKELSPGRMITSSRSEQVGDNVEEIDAAVEGEPSKIAFNGKYLMDVLSVLHEPDVALETTTQSSPGVIRPMGRDNYVHVIMPMFVQW
jgi:DNA polymerase-3 subunit beta